MAKEMDPIDFMKDTMVNNAARVIAYGQYSLEFMIANGYTGVPGYKFEEWKDEILAAVKEFKKKYLGEETDEVEEFLKGVSEGGFSIEQ